MTIAPPRFFGALERDRATGVWRMQTPFPHVSIRVKQIFPRVPKQSLGLFTFPDSEPMCHELEWFLKLYPMEMTDVDARHLAEGRKAFHRNIDQISIIQAPDWVPPSYVGLKEGQEIRPAQASAIETLKIMKRLLVGDLFGAGKTYTGMGGALVPGLLPAAFVVQPHLSGQWARKLEQFTNLRYHEVDSRKPYSLPEADVYIYRYSLIQGWPDIFAQRPFKYAVFDEIQELRRGTESQKGAAANILSQHVEYALGLSATPIYGYGSEIHNVMAILDPSVLGDRADFDREWTTDCKVVRDPEALGSYLQSTGKYLRRGRGQDTTQIVIEEVEFDNDKFREAEELAETLAIKTLTGSFVERGRAAQQFDAQMRLQTGLAKAKGVARYVRMIVESGEPVILAGWHRDVYDIWLKELADLKTVMYTGSETPKQKDAAFNAFVNGEADIFIMSNRSGAGVDGLQARATIYVNGELDWSPEVMRQGYHRLDREGKIGDILAVFLVAQGGSDPIMLDVCGLKSSQAQGINDPGIGVQTVVDGSARVRHLARKYLEKRGHDVSKFDKPVFDTSSEPDAVEVELGVMPAGAAAAAAVHAQGA